VREATADLACDIDCIGGFTSAALTLFKELDQFNLAMIEQSLAHDDLIEHARLPRKVVNPDLSG